MKYLILVILLALAPLSWGYKFSDGTKFRGSVDAGIVCLPVHDAVAVQRRHVDWAVEVMTNAWAEIAYGLRPKVKVE